MLTHWEVLSTLFVLCVCVTERRGVKEKHEKEEREESSESVTSSILRVTVPSSKSFFYHLLVPIRKKSVK